MATAKITVAEWIAFLSEKWRDGLYADDTCIAVGEEYINSDHDMDPEFLSKYELSALVTIETGVVLDENDRKFSQELRRMFLAWRKRQQETIIVVEVKKDRADALIALIKANGGSICKWDR